MNIGFCTLLVSTKIALLWERERETDNYVVLEKKCNGKKIKWKCRGSNPGPFACKANAVPLSYIAILEDTAFKKYTFIYCRTLLRCYDRGRMKWILLTIFIKPFFYERFLDWHNTRFNGLTHIFFRLVGKLLLTCKNIMPHAKILEHISNSNSSW